ncbi:MAG TPA: hypothetical protein VN855_00555 [Candidatus Acidoferrum sp.]|nr:hypothetical protein [Candidatus Acidoferrum sp.]
MENPLISKVKVTKILYKFFDSHQRYERWALKELLKFSGVSEEMMGRSKRIKEIMSDGKKR